MIHMESEETEIPVQGFWCSLGWSQPPCSQHILCGRLPFMSCTEHLLTFLPHPLTAWVYQPSRGHCLRQYIYICSLWRTNRDFLEVKVAYWISSNGCSHRRLLPRMVGVQSTRLQRWNQLRQQVSMHICKLSLESSHLSDFQSVLWR